jgi:hypothetical protein
MKTHTSILLGGLCLVLWSGPPRGLAATATLTVAEDTFINAGSPNANAGANAWFDAGTDGNGDIRRGLLQFDVSSIPPRSTVTSVSVQLTVVKVPGANPVDSTFDLFRLLANWGEGTKTGNSGSTATAGEATWTARILGTANWTTPGAKKDAVATASASTPVTGEATYSWSGSGLVADVQLWVNNPSQNFGWLLASRAESSSHSVRGFASRESGSSGGTLVVVYTAPALSVATAVSGCGPGYRVTFWV